MLSQVQNSNFGKLFLKKMESDSTVPSFNFSASSPLTVTRTDNEQKDVSVPTTFSFGEDKELTQSIAFDSTSKKIPSFNFGASTVTGTGAAGRNKQKDDVSIPNNFSFGEDKEKRTKRVDL